MLHSACSQARLWLGADAAARFWCRRVLVQLQGPHPLAYLLVLFPCVVFGTRKWYLFLVSAQSLCLLGCCKNPASPTELKHSVMSVFSLNTTETSCGIWGDHMQLRDWWSFEEKLIPSCKYLNTGLKEVILSQVFFIIYSASFGWSTLSICVADLSFAAWYSFRAAPAVHLWTFTMEVSHGVWFSSTLLFQILSPLTWTHFGMGV